MSNITPWLFLTQSHDANYQRPKTKDHLNALPSMLDLAGGELVVVIIIMYRELGFNVTATWQVICK